MAEGGRWPQDDSLESGMFKSKLIHCCLTSMHAYTYHFTMLDSCHIHFFLIWRSTKIFSQPRLLVCILYVASGVAESDCCLSVFISQKVTFRLQRTSSHKHCSHSVTLLYLFRLSHLSATGSALSASSYTTWLHYVQVLRLQDCPSRPAAKTGHVGNGALPSPHSPTPSTAHSLQWEKGGIDWGGGEGEEAPEGTELIIIETFMNTVTTKSPQNIYVLSRSQAAK